MSTAKELVCRKCTQANNPIQAAEHPGYASARPHTHGRSRIQTAVLHTHGAKALCLALQHHAGQAPAEHLHHAALSQPPVTGPACSVRQSLDSVRCVWYYVCMGVRIQASVVRLCMRGCTTDWPRGHARAHTVEITQRKCKVVKALNPHEPATARQ